MKNTSKFHCFGNLTYKIDEKRYKLCEYIYSSSDI